MRILIIADHWAVASGRYAFDALKRLGHEVRSHGVPHGTLIWGHQVAPDYEWVPDDLDPAWVPELVILMDGNMRAPELPKKWACPVVVYGVDNHVRDYHQFDGMADRFFLAHGHGMRMGESNVEWLPCGYDPVHFTPGPKLDERAFDAALIGVIYGQRAEMLYALGATFNNTLRITYGTGAVYDQYAAAYQNARVSLAASAHNDVAQRVWETAAMGCVVLKDANNDDEALGLVNHKNCLIYHSTREACDLMRWLSEHPKDAQRIADAGRKWAQDGTWDNRLQVIVDWAQSQSKAGRKSA